MMFTPENTNFKLEKKPNIIEMFRYGQISELQQKLSNILSCYRYPVQQEVLIPNPKYPKHPFRIDIVVGSPDTNQTAVEVDGKAFHDNPKSKERDNRKTKVMKAMGYQIVRLPYEIPRDLIYGHLQGCEREEVKGLYEQYKANWINANVQKIIQIHEYNLPF